MSSSNKDNQSKLRNKNSIKKLKSNATVRNPAPSQSILHETTLGSYLAQISKYPLLTSEEENRLARAFYETKDPKIAQILATSNLRFVVNVAKKYSQFSSKLMDLIQEGNIGLLKAIQNFNPYKGVKLITYAVWWIRGYVQEYLLKQHSIVRIGASKKQKSLFYLLQKEQKFLENFSDKHLLPNLSKVSSVNKTEIDELRERVKYKDVSLDKFIDKEGTTSLLDLQINKSESDIEDLIYDKEEKEKLNQVLKTIEPHLNEKEKQILKRRILKIPPETLESIGKDFKVTKESIRQSESKLMDKLRTYAIPIFKPLPSKNNPIKIKKN